MLCCSFFFFYQVGVKSPLRLHQSGTWGVPVGFMLLCHAKVWERFYDILNSEKQLSFLTLTKLSELPKHGQNKSWFFAALETILTSYAERRSTWIKTLKAVLHCATLYWPERRCTSPEDSPLGPCSAWPCWAAAPVVTPHSEVTCLWNYVPHTPPANAYKEYDTHRNEK